MEVSIEPYVIHKIETHLLDMSLTGMYGSENENLFARLFRLHKTSKELFEYYDPVAVALEAGFINRFRPNAFGPLSRSLMVIEQASIDVNKDIIIKRYAPKFIKKVSVDKGSSDKNDVLYGVKGIESITVHIDPTVLSEHEVDALAIVYTLADDLKRNSFFYELLHKDKEVMK